MPALLHSLNIGTLATWLSVAGFGSVGVIVRESHTPPAAVTAEESSSPVADFTLGDAGNPETPGQPADPLLPEAAASVPETLPAPPELPEISEFAPLPEIPEIPAPAARPAQTRAESQPRQTSRSASSTTASPARNSSTTGGSGSGKPGAASPGMSSSARLAAGRMPPPSYPAEARRLGQTGTVLVEFTVDTSGRVISAHAKSPSPWPLLNHEAVRTVRRWKFPPGGVMKLQRPIVFQLR